MKLNFSLDGKSYEVKAILETKSRAGELLINGAPYPVSFSYLDPKTISLSWGGRQIRIFIDRSKEEVEIIVNGYPYKVQKGILREVPSKARFQGAIPDQVSPLTPSVVVKVLISEGELVSEGQPLVVVSAMKMETTLRAPYRGKVKKVRAKVGQKVGPGDILVDIERVEE